MSDRTERKLGRAILEIIQDVQRTPNDNLPRYLLLERKLKKATVRYQEHTGSDHLLHPASHYGFTYIK